MDGNTRGHSLSSFNRKPTLRLDDSQAKLSTLHRTSRSDLAPSTSCLVSSRAFSPKSATQINPNHAQTSITETLPRIYAKFMTSSIYEEIVRLQTLLGTDASVDD